jgi:hypothetical protein
MPNASPGAILPGSTPAAASSSVLKGLFTLQGAALLGAGAWLFLKGRKGKSVKRNPGKFRAKARRRVRGKFLRANEAIQRDYDKWWSASRAATGKRSYGSPASWARKSKIVKLAVKAGALGPAAKSATSQARRHQGIFRRSWFKTYGKALDNPLPAGSTYDQAVKANNEGRLSDFDFQVFAIAWSQNKMSDLAKRWKKSTNIAAYEQAIKDYPHCFGVKKNPASKTAARYEARMRNYFSGKGRMPKATGLSHDESWAIIWKIQDELGHKRSVPVYAPRINPGKSKIWKLYRSKPGSRSFTIEWQGKAKSFTDAVSKACKSDPYLKSIRSELVAYK